MSEVITGDKELDQLLQELGGKIIEKITKRSLGKGLTILARAICNTVPATTTSGHSNKSIKQSIGTSNRKNRRKGIHESKVGVGVGRGHHRKKGVWYARLLAMGTNDRMTGKNHGPGWLKKQRKPAYRGKIKKYEFVKQGLANADDMVMGQIRYEFFRLLEVESGKLKG